MATTTYNLRTYPDWSQHWTLTTPSQPESRFRNSTQAALKSLSRIPEHLTNLVFSPENLSDLYTTFYIREGICSTDPAPPLAAASPSDQLALIRDSFGFTVTEIAEIFGLSRPTVYKWKNEGTRDSAVLGKLRLLQELGEYWADSTAGRPLSWLLDFTGDKNNEPSILSLLRQDNISKVEVQDLIDRRIRGHEAASLRAQQILGNHGELESLNPTTGPTKAEQRKARAWKRLRSQSALHRK